MSGGFKESNALLMSVERTPVYRFSSTFSFQSSLSFITVFLQLWFQQKSFRFSSVQSAGKPIEEAVILHASFRTFITFSTAILLVNLQTTGLGPRVASLVGVR